MSSWRAPDCFPTPSTSQPPPMTCVDWRRGSTPQDSYALTRWANGPTSAMSAGRLAHQRAPTPQTSWPRPCPSPRRWTAPARASYYWTTEPTPPARRCTGLTPLHFAASTSGRRAAEILVQRGAPLDARDDLHHGTPLDWAIHNGATDVELLRLLGAHA